MYVILVSSLSPNRESAPCCQATSMVAYSRWTGAGDVKQTLLLITNQMCAKQKQKLTGGEEVFDGIDSGCGGGLRSSQGSVGQRRLEHTQLLQGLMGSR